MPTADRTYACHYCVVTTSTPMCFPRLLQPQRTFRVSLRANAGGGPSSPGAAETSKADGRRAVATPSPSIARLAVLVTTLSWLSSLPSLPSTAKGVVAVRIISAAAPAESNKPFSLSDTGVEDGTRPRLSAVVTSLAPLTCRPSVWCTVKGLYCGEPVFNGALASS